METAQRTVRFWQLHNRIEKSRRSLSAQEFGLALSVWISKSLKQVRRDAAREIAVEAPRFDSESAELFGFKKARERLHTKNVHEVSFLCSG